MIYIVTRHDHAHTIEELCRDAAGLGVADLRPLAYGDLFAERIAPVGHYIFTDFDRLTSYEIEVAETLARHLEEAAPDARILNRPVEVLERFPLLRRLRRLGLNDFSAVRIDAGDLPSRYPVFLRMEDDCKNPDTGLLHTEAELIAAIEALQRAGKPLKRRIAVEFCAAPNEDGYYRKYGVFRIGDHIIPHNVMMKTDWHVKRATGQRRPDEFDPHGEEKTNFPKKFSHAADVMKRFDIAGIGFGRIDYGFVDGRLQTYEINTNPTFPPIRPKADDPRAERRAILRQRVGAALADLDVPLSSSGTFRFKLPRPRLQTFVRSKAKPADLSAGRPMPADEQQPT